MSWAGQPNFIFSFIIISAKHPLTHVVIFLAAYVQIVCMFVVCSVCWKSITIAHT